MRTIISCTILLAAFFTVEPAPQRGPLEGGLLPIGSILSQLQEFRANARQRPELIGVILDPLSRLSNSRPSLRRPGRPNRNQNKVEDKDQDAQTEDVSEENPQPEQKRPGNKNKDKQADKKREQVAQTEDVSEENPQPEQKRPGNKNKNKQADKKKDQEVTQPPQSPKDKNEGDSPQPSSTSNSEKEGEEIEQFIRPPPPDVPKQPTTEDWTKVSSANPSGVDQVTRKILGAPCLGGLARDGTCKVAFDDE